MMTVSSCYTNAALLHGDLHDFTALVSAVRVRSTVPSSSLGSRKTFTTALSLPTRTVEDSTVAGEKALMPGVMKD
jgi:hypothetical protein